MSGTLFGPTLPRGGGSSSGGGVTTDRRAPAIIVGNALQGDTSADCDYVDAGDCVQLSAALAAAYMGHPRDVWIRPGVYRLSWDLAPLVIQPTVHVRGAGRGRVSIHTATTGPLGIRQSAWEIRDLATLEDVAVVVEPSLQAVTGQHVITLLGQRAEAHRVDVSFAQGWDITAITNTALLACFGVERGGLSDAKVIDCQCGDARAPLPSFVAIGGKPASLGLRAINVMDSPDSLENSMMVERLISWGGDHGIVIGARCRVHSCSIHVPYYFGAWIQGAVSTPGAPDLRCKFSENEITMNNRNGHEVGLFLDEAGSNEIIDNYFHAEVQSAIGIAIENKDGRSNQIRGNRCNRGWRDGIRLSLGTAHNLAALNDMSNAATPYTDNGANNDLAHNK